MKRLGIMAFSLLLVVSAVWADDVWTGAVDTDWANSGNWLNNTVPGGIATFSGAPTANQPTLFGGRGIGTIDFQSAGWTISGDGDPTLTFSNLSAVTSAGAGVNVIDVNFSDQYVDNMVFQAAADNTLVMNGDYFPRRAYVTAGAGKIVFNGTSASTSLTWTLGEGTTLFNTPNTIGVGRSATVALGGTLGGTAPIMQINAYSSMSLADGANFSPGGDGVYGDPISTMRIKSSSATTRAYFDMGGASSSLIMDLGANLGENDQVVVDLSASNGYFYLRDCELALRGPATLADGDYTLISELSGNYSGQFGSITYNGALVDPANFSLTYNEDSVVLSVADVPEPATLSLLAIGAVAMIRRRR